MGTVKWLNVLNRGLHTVATFRAMKTLICKGTYNGRACKHFEI